LIAAFWSNDPGLGCTSSDLAALAVTLSLQYGKKIVMLENHISMRDLKSMLMGGHYRSVIKERDYAMDYGVERAFRSGGQETASDWKENAEALIPDRLWYLPIRTENDEVYVYHLEKIITPLLSELNQEFDCVFVDLSAGKNPTTQLILNQADLIVMNLFQHPRTFTAALSEVSAWKDKLFYLFGDYVEDSRFSSEKYRRFFGLPEGRIGRILHSPLYQDAIYTGNVIRFITAGQNGGRHRIAYDFFHELDTSAELICPLLESSGHTQEEGGVL